MRLGLLDREMGTFSCFVVRILLVVTGDWHHREESSIALVVPSNLIVVATNRGLSMRMPLGCGSSEGEDPRASGCPVYQEWFL